MDNPIHQPLNIQSASLPASHEVYIVSPNDPRFCQLAAQLEDELRDRDGNDADALAELNMATHIDVAAIACNGNELIGCGAWRGLTNLGAVELKRMYVVPKFRGSGVAAKILVALENSAPGGSRIVLETGKNQPEALTFYAKYGYQQIAAFEPYTENNNSVCFEKIKPAQL